MQKNRIKTSNCQLTETESKTKEHKSHNPKIRGIFKCTDIQLNIHTLIQEFIKCIYAEKDNEMFAYKI